ncbi:MAG: hypothetical protein QM538_04205 [Methylacidiphilales bacterium]|nr:hypothetical protein [Candidatus Methylacidiphilales bacterium]
MYGTKIPHKVSKDGAKWLKREIAVQVALYKRIVKSMDALSVVRDKWYSEFLERIQVRGFNADGDVRVKIKPTDIPVKPKRKDKVVW